MKITGVVKKKYGPFGNNVNLLLTASAVIFALIGQLFLYTTKNITFGLLFHAFGAANIIFSGIFYDKKHRHAGHIFSDNPGAGRFVPGLKKEAAVFLLIILLGSFFRFYDINGIPEGCFRDEGKLAMDSVSIMNGKVPDGADSRLPVYIRDLTDNPAMYNYIMAACFRLTGGGVVEAREVSAVTGMLAVAAMYFLLRLLFGPAGAACGGLLFAVMRWHVTFSRTIYHVGFAIFLLIPVLYFFFLALKSKNPRNFILLGIVSGLAVYTYQAARAIPFAMAAAALFLAVFDREYFKENINNFTLAGIVFFLTALPLVLYMAGNYSGFTQRARELSIFNYVEAGNFFGANGILARYFNSAWRVLLMFNFSGDKNLAYNAGALPMLDFVQGGLAVLGFSYTVYEAITGSKRAALLLVFFTAFLHGGILFTGAPHGTRTALVIPFLAVFAAVPAVLAFRPESGNGRERRNTIIAFVFICLFLVSAAENFHNYFIVFGRDPGAWQAFDADTTKAAEFLAELGPGWRGFLAEKYMHGSEKRTYEFEITAQKYRYLDYRRFERTEQIPAPDGAGKNIVYILTPEYLPVLPALLAAYPGGKYIPVYEHFSREKLAFFAFEAGK
jgi:4-amino-4-deoxy-L-arabinose transferase-like glycosyltransferase